MRERWQDPVAASPGAAATVRPVSDPETAVASKAGAEAPATSGNRGAAVQAAIDAESVWKTFRLPYDRPSTFKQRVLHPRLSRVARQLHALREVSFEVESGEFFGIIGRNGSGKSTLLMCLAGIYQPDRGKIVVSGRVSPFIELGVGFNPELTARDNVVVNAALLGIPKGEALARFSEIIRFAELEQFVDLKLKNYSSGMQVRLGFSAAIQAEADIYLVDEVLAVGDAGFQEKCFDVFRRFKREGRTVVFVTHDLGSVERFCDRALLLERGEVTTIGTPHEAVRTYRQHNLEAEQAQAHAGLEGSTKRWGDGAAEIVEVWVEDAAGKRREVLPQGESATYRARVRFDRPMHNPVFGVIIKAEGGQHILVTNTMFGELETGAFDGGDEAIYLVRLELWLADGVYTVSPAVAYEDAQRFADWREDFATFSVRSDRYSGGLVDLPHEMAVERLVRSSGSGATV
jgi:ABC-type polysaccharide/polyol phosphate transport system ATPase subunit